METSPIEKKEKDRPLIILLYVFFISIILYLGKSLFVPLSIALLISFILYPFCGWLERHKVPRFTSIFIGLSVFMISTLSVVGLLTYQFLEFMKEWPELAGKLEVVLSELDKRFSSTWASEYIDNSDGILGSAVNYLSTAVLPEIPQTLYRSTVSLVLFVIIPVFSALILYYRSLLMNFLYQIFPESSAHYIRKLMPEVIITYYNFIKGMGMVYLVVGILNSLGLFLIGIPNPIFFGFVASILTFIPYVGITIGALLPMAVSWIKYDSVMYPLGVIIIFSIVQILEANVIFPLAVSQRLKINTLVTLVVIVGGGIIWGAMGMILFIPFVAILKLISDHVEVMRPISILLGTNLKPEISEKEKK